MPCSLARWRPTNGSGTGCLGLSGARRPATVVGRLDDRQFSIAILHRHGLEEGNRVARRKTVLQRLIELVVDLGLQRLLVCHATLLPGATRFQEMGCRSNGRHG